MPLEKKTVTIPLAAPLSQATDDTMVDPTQVVVRANDVVYEKDGQIAMAPGYVNEGVMFSKERNLASIVNDRLHFVQNIFGDLVIGGVAKGSPNPHIWPGDYYQSAYAASSVILNRREYLTMGKMYPIQQEKFVAAANRETPHSVDSTFIGITEGSNTVGLIWSAWIEDGCVMLSCIEAGTNNVRSAPGSIVITDMTADINRVRILTVGSYIHVYGSQWNTVPGDDGEIRLAVFLGSTFAGTVASVVAGEIPARAWVQLAGPHINTVIEAEDFGWGSNGITVQLINDSPAAGGVTIDVTPSLNPSNPYIIVIHFEDNVDDATDIQTAIGLLAGDDDVIRVRSNSTLGGNCRAADNQTVTLGGAQDVWDAITWSGYAVLAYRNEKCTTADRLTITSRLAAGGAGPWGPSTFNRSPAWALAICKCRDDVAGNSVLAVVSQEEYFDNTRRVQLSTHQFNATFTQVLANTTIDTATAVGAGYFSRLTAATICQETIHEYINNTYPVIMTVLEYVIDMTIPVDEWTHNIHCLQVRTDTGVVFRDIQPYYGFHRILSRAFEYDERAHFWLAHEMETSPVAELCCIGINQVSDVITDIAYLDTQAVWHRLTVEPSQARFSSVLGSIVQEFSEPMPYTNYYWPAICRETQDTYIIRVSKYNYLAQARKSIEVGSGVITSASMLLGTAGRKMFPYGFCYPPTIFDGEATLDELDEDAGVGGDSTYKYITTYEWMDANGELHVSAPSLPITVETPRKPFTDGQSLEIVAGSNDEIALTVVTRVIGGAWSAPTGVVVTVPAGVYEDFDELGKAMGDAMTEQVRDAMLAAFLVTPDAVFYCFKDTSDFIGLLNEENQALDMTRFKICCHSDSGCLYIDTIVWTFAGLNSIGESLGFDDTADIDVYNAGAGTVEEEQVYSEFAGANISHYPNSWAIGTVSVEWPETPAKCVVELEVEQYVPGDLVYNMETMRIAVYRTQANGGTYTMVGKHPAYSLLEPTTTITDKMSDEEAQSQPSLYSTGEPGDVLENCPCTPSGPAMIVHRDRVYLVNEELPTEVYASLPIRTGYAIEFTEFIKIQFPEAITGLASLPDMLVAFSATKAYALTGEGPNALGIGEFSALRIVSKSAGADNHNSIVDAGAGLIFHSEDSGLWLMSPGGAVQDMTVLVEDELAGQVKTSLMRPDEQRVEIYFESGYGLWYDLRHQRWSVQHYFDDITSACLHESNTVHVANGLMGSSVCTQGGYVRNNAPYMMNVKTGWIKLNGLAGYQRLWWESLVGEYVGSHAIIINKYLDYNPVMDSTLTRSISSNPGSYLIKKKPQKQKMSSVQYDIFINPLTSPYNSVKLNALELVCGVKQRKHPVKGR